MLIDADRRSSHIFGVIRNMQACKMIHVMKISIFGDSECENEAIVDRAYIQQRFVTGECHSGNDKAKFRHASGGSICMQKYLVIMELLFAIHHIIFSIWADSRERKLRDSRSASTNPRGIHRHDIRHAFRQMADAYRLRLPIFPDEPQAAFHDSRVAGADAMLAAFEQLKIIFITGIFHRLFGRQCFQVPVTS